MGIRKFFSRFSCFTGSTAPRPGPSSLNGTPCVPVPEPSHDIPLTTPNSPATAPLPDPEDVPAVVQIHTPSIPPSDVSSSTVAVGSSSKPPSSVHDERGYITQIRGAADAVDLDGLSNYISEYLAFIKGEGKKPSPLSAAKCYWPSSQAAIYLNELLSGVAETLKVSDAKTIAQEFLKGVGGVHVAAIGFLVIGKTMERYEKIKENKEECMWLLERMKNLIQEVKQLKERPQLMEAMKAKIKEAMELITEASLACCTQIDRPKYKKFLSTDVNKKELQRFLTRLTEMHRKIQFQIGFVQLGLQLREPPRPPGASEQFRRENKEQIEKITKQLQWESEESAVAVILYGLGGTGKTALADAVYWSLYHEKVLPFRNHEEVLKCKYSFVRLFDDTGKIQKIEMLQTQVLQDLTSREQEIRRYEQGRDAIKKVLEEEAVFIYIDNVLFPDKVEEGQDAIERLLPTTTKKVRKLRLLITTRDKGAAVKACKKLIIETELYPIETLEHTKAMQLVKEELNAEDEDLGRDEKLDCIQINQIVQICGGIPQVLKEVAAYIRLSENRVEGFHQVIWERENNWKGRVRWDTIARYAFAHEHLDEELKDLFFDICSYFERRNWEELSNIVGDFELKRLEDRALVTKDVKSMTAKVNNVILAIGIHNKGRRFKFTSASEFQRVLNPNNDEHLCDIKGIWSNDNIGPLDISASKLDLMCESLRVLALENSTEVKCRCNRTFAKLCFFSAKISHNPFDMSKVKPLRYLCYSTDDLQNLCQMPRNLISNFRILQLRQCGSIERLPESIGQFNFLDSIDLSSTDLKKLPDEFCSLSSLKELVMDNCWRLEELPHGFGDLRSLRKLRLWGCVSLKKLPETFSQLKLLEDLNLSCCVTLKELCAGFKSLSSLRILLLGTCRMLEKLPQDFHCLTLLEHLCLSDCDKLEGKVMESIVKMETLQTVDIQRSPLLRKACQNMQESLISNMQGKTLKKFAINGLIK